MADKECFHAVTEQDEARIEGLCCLCLKAENKKLKNSMMCLWCKKVLSKDEVKLTEHLLECKDHPLARRIEQLQAEVKELKDTLRFTAERLESKGMSHCEIDGVLDE